MKAKDTIPPAAGSRPAVRLLPGREKLSRSFHPWVFSGAIAPPDAPGAPRPPRDGDVPGPAGQILPGLVRVEDSRGAFVAWAQHHPASKIALRLLEWREAALPDAGWLESRLREAFARRLEPAPAGTTAQRLVFSEADRLPGLIIERLGDWLVVQSENRVVDAWMEGLASCLPAIARSFIPGLQGILERSDGDGRQLEGLSARSAVLWGSIPDQAVLVHENGLGFWLDLRGQKAGFYTDQRENRALVARYAAGRRVLDVCCYSGGFSVAAQAAGAAGLTLVDASAEALDLARRNLDGHSAEFIQGDAFQVLRRLQADQPAGQTASAVPGEAPLPAVPGSRFDLIILDPPKLAPNRNSLDRALAAYKDLNLQALRLLAPGGLLASFSCSGLVSADDLRQAIAYAAKDAGRQVQILHHLFQAPCHPVLLSFPEGQYLKGFLLRVV